MTLTSKTPFGSNELKTPLSPGGDGFSSTLKTVLEKSSERHGWQFVCDGLELTTEEVSALDGMMPLVVWKASHHLEPIWGHQDLVFRCNSEALVGVTLEPVRPILPLSIWLHALHFTVAEAARVARAEKRLAISMDGWFAEWQAALSAKKVLLLPPAPAPAPSTR